MTRQVKNHQIKKHVSRLTSNHILVIFLAILIGSQVWLSNRLATAGQQLSDLEEKAVALEEENRKLLSANVNELSLRELAQVAEKMGFVQPEKIINFGQADKNLASR